jgi:hypothetical protein
MWSKRLNNDCIEINPKRIALTTVQVLDINPIICCIQGEIRLLARILKEGVQFWYNDTLLPFAINWSVSKFFHDVYVSKRYVMSVTLLPRNVHVYIRFWHVLNQFWNVYQFWHVLNQFWNVKHFKIDSKHVKTGCKHVHSAAITWGCDWHNITIWNVNIMKKFGHWPLDCKW